MLRHERACDAAKKTTKKRRSFGLEEVHPGEPYGRPNSPQSPKNKQTASACLIGHIWGFVAASSAVLFFGGDLPLSWRIGRDRPPVRRVQLDLDTRCRYPTPVLPLPRLPTRLLWAEEEKRFLQLSRGGVNRLRTGCFLSFRNDLTRGFDSLFSGHTGQYGGSDTN